VILGLLWDWDILNAFSRLLKDFSTIDVVFKFFTIGGHKGDKLKRIGLVGFHKKKYERVVSL
jgi:hypothetical protein